LNRLALYDRARNVVVAWVRGDTRMIPRPPFELAPEKDLLAGWKLEPTAVDREAFVEAIKGRCREEIIARYPEWKQLNMIAQAVELLEIKIERRWTEEEAKESEVIRKAWGWIKERRAQSDAEEKDLG
jgi:hypothetical protein